MQQASSSPIWKVQRPVEVIHERHPGAWTQLPMDLSLFCKAPPKRRPVLSRADPGVAHDGERLGYVFDRRASLHGAQEKFIVHGDRVGRVEGADPIEKIPSAEASLMQEAGLEAQMPGGAAGLPALLS